MRKLNAEDQRLFKAWRKKYGKVVDGPRTVVCNECESRMEGDGPEAVIQCWLCYRKERTGKKS